MKTKYKIYACIFLVSILIFGDFLYCNRKENIHNATVMQLDNVKEIGEVLSKQIYSYVQTNSINDVESLQGHIKYLGDARIKELKKIYK